MILKSLELTGFKSFVDLTRLDFDNGSTAIVGPNGCGKSNVSDAIRWIIGEQSSKTLRGTKTSDLIFNGSDSRKPVNRTEITLTLGDVPPGIRVANVPNLGEEIKVTRCYHRSGESEFYINRIPCRLKDITDLFLDAGISPKALTVIEQNHIHHIISSKPEDRRILIEEAAGILKFKHRKNEALRKLEVSGQNLARVGDIVQELGRHVESLKRQAAKAERYKKYQSEIKDLSLNLFAKRLRQYQERLRQIEEEHNRETERKAELSAQSSTLENQIAGLKMEIDELSSALYRKKEAIHDLSSKMSKNEHAVEIKKHQIEQARQDTSTADEEILQMKGEIDGLRAETESRRGELGKTSEEINAQEETCDAKSKAMEADREQLRYREEAVRLGEKQTMSLYQRIAQKRNDLTALETRKRFLETRDEKLQKELAETGAAMEQTRASLAQAEREQEEKALRFESLKRRKEELQSQAGECGRKLKEQSERLNFAKEVHMGQSSLLNSLKELRSKFEGFDEGVKTLMAYHANGGRLAGLREALADVLQAPAEFETAIEAALGEKLQSVIVDSYTDSVEAIGYLKTQKSGRGFFIPMKPKSLPQMPLYLNGNRGVMGKALDYIQCKEEYRPIIERLLGNVVLVEDLETALHLHANENFNGVVVTRNGEVIDSQGVVSGGELRKNQTSLLAQNREMEELCDRVAALKRELDAAQAEHGLLAEQTNSLEEKLKESQTQVHQAEIAASNGRKDLESAHKEMQRLEQKRSTLDYERYSGAQESQELAAERETLEQAAVSLDEEKAREEESLANLRADLEKGREELQRKAAEIGTVKVLIASLKGKRENTFTEIRRLDLQQENLRQRVDKREADKSANAAKIEQYLREIADLERSILEQIREKDRLSEEVAREEEDLLQKEENLKQMERDSRALYQRVQEVSESLSRTELKRSELKIQAAHLEEKAYDDFNSTVQEMLDGYKGEVDEAETEETLRDLKDKVAKMGEINLAALSDFEQTNSRYVFLKKQEEDLAQSIKALHEAIDKINLTTMQRFLETFHQVNDNFRTCFARLFEGGKAELILVDEANPLDSGIDIVAQPLGKKNQSITLLSQGEKAMTAVALMFSIFRVRPSPFCLLDEVDAPLDEANVIRFQDMLREMSDNTQFIVITHNQKTMSFADVLYGITMEEKGVSKVVSVHLNN